MRAKSILRDITSGINSRLFGGSNAQPAPAKPPPAPSRRQPSGSHVLGGLTSFSQVEKTRPSSQPNVQAVSRVQAMAPDAVGLPQNAAKVRLPARGKENKPLGDRLPRRGIDNRPSANRATGPSDPAAKERRQTPLTETHVARLGHEVLQSIEALPRDSRKREHAMKAMEEIVPNLRNMSPTEALHRINVVKLALAAPAEHPRQPRTPLGQTQGQRPGLPGRSEVTPGVSQGVRSDTRPHVERTPRGETNQPSGLRSHSGTFPTQRDVKLQAHEIMGQLGQLLRGPQSQTARAVILDVIGKIQGMPVQSAIGKLAELRSLIAIPDARARNHALVDFSEKVLNLPLVPNTNERNLRHDVPQNARPATTAPPTAAIRARTSERAPAPTARTPEPIPYRSLAEFEQDAREEARYGPTGTQPDYAEAKQKFEHHNARYEAQFRPARSGVPRTGVMNKPEPAKAPPFRPLESFEQDARDEARYGPTGTQPDYGEAKRKFDLQSARYEARAEPRRSARPPTSPSISPTRQREPIPYRSLAEFEQDARDEARYGPSGTQPDYADARQKFDRHNALYEAQFKQNRTA